MQSRNSKNLLNYAIFLVLCHICVNYSEFIRYGAHQPAPFLGYELGVHATLVVVGVEEVVDIEAQRQASDIVFGTEVDDGARFHLFLIK